MADGIPTARGKTKCSVRVERTKAKAKRAGEGWIDWHA